VRRPAHSRSRAARPRAQDGWLSGWQVEGTNTGRISIYDAHGPGAGSPYPFEGLMGYDELDLRAYRRESAYDAWRAEFSGVLNADDYRSADKGIVPERMSLVRENGEAAIPYRLELGDHFAYYSYLTLQRSLKGAQVEWQPGGSSRARRHSLVLTAGADEPSWRSLTPRDDFTTGISWLVSDVALGSININAVHNHGDAVASRGLLQRNQLVLSVAGEKPFTAGSHRLVFEAEAAALRGDHDGVIGAASGQDQSDTGWFAAMRGQALTVPWDYELRYERYGQDFRPRGAVVPPDRRTLEARSGWRFDNGILLRGRVQRFEDGIETANPTYTRTSGLTLSGPLLRAWVPGSSARVDAFVQNQNNEARTLSRITRSLIADARFPIGAGWNAHAGVFLQHRDDRSAGDVDRLTQQVSFGAGHRISLGRLTGFVTPGIVLRKVTLGRSHDVDVNPTLALRLAGGPHGLDFDVGSLLQNRSAALGGTDVGTHTVNMNYRYRRRAHEFGLEANLFGRDPDGIDATAAYRVAVSWTWHFDRPPQRAGALTLAPAGEAAAPAAPARAGVLELAPGVPADVALAVLLDAGAGTPSAQDEWQVWEFALLERVLRRQRLGLELAGGELRRMVLVIDFDDSGDTHSVRQSFESVRKALIETLGAPTRSFSEGDFGPAFAAEVNAQRFINVTEWDTREGTTIRFGVPRRLDGQVRMEVQHARRFASPRDTLWSADAIR